MPTDSEARTAPRTASSLRPKAIQYLMLACLLSTVVEALSVTQAVVPIASQKLSTLVEGTGQSSDSAVVATIDPERTLAPP